MRWAWWRRSDEAEKEAIVTRLEQVADHLEEVTHELRAKVDRLRAEGQEDSHG